MDKKEFVLKAVADKKEAEKILKAAAKAPVTGLQLITGSKASVSEEAEQLSDRIAIMVSGKLRAVGTLSELEALTGEKGLENAFIKIAEAREGSVNA